MEPVILYRKGINYDSDAEEIQSASKYFSVIHERTLIKPNSLVVGRMSVLPFYRELELDLHNQGAKLINSYRQHQFIADMREWVEILSDLTPKLYWRLQDLPEMGPFVVKGQTNSKKHLWDTHMFAKGRKEAVEVYLKLKEDSLFDNQEIYARDYVPLVKLGEAMNSLPITKEFRFFVAYGKLLTGAFYWASHTDDVSIPDVTEVPKEFLQQVINLIGDNANFYALDVAQTQEGKWIVIEINDGQMSGLSCNNPDDLYKNLRLTF